MSEWTPIGHRPPLPPIDTGPSYTPAPVDTVPVHVRQQIDQMEQMMRAKEGARVWQHVVDVAKGA